MSATVIANISVVIPLYNKAPHITRAMDSVLAQTVQPKEIIVVDDGSTDGSGEVVKNYIDPRIILVPQENQGEGAARNRGIVEAKEDLIAFLDADDAWKPKFLEMICHLRENYPNAGAYGTAYEIITPAGIKMIPKFNFLLDGLKEGVIENYIRKILDNMIDPIHPSSVAIPTSTFLKVGYFPVGEQLGVDTDTWLRIALKYPIAWSNDYLAVYCQNAQQRILGFLFPTREMAVSRTARKAIKSGLIPPEQVDDLIEYASFFQLEVAKNCLMAGKRETALEMLKYSRETRRFAKAWRKRRLLAMLPPGWPKILWELREKLLCFRGDG